MTFVPGQTEHQPTSMLVCPRCAGTGRVGEGREPCQACWCAGVVEPWKAQKLIDEEARRNGVAPRAATVEVTVVPPADGGAGPESDPSGHARRAGLVEPCTKCRPTDRCPQCPFIPFVLVA
jgi:hypothetical protein